MTAPYNFTGGLPDDRPPQHHGPYGSFRIDKTLMGYAERYEREHGCCMEAVTLPRATWLALGKPEMAAGVRITPTDDARAPVPPKGG